MRHTFSCDPHVLFGYMTVFRAGGEDGKFEPELSSLSNGINLLYLLI